MQRIGRQDFARSPAQYQDEPIVIEEALSTTECDDWLQHMFQRSAKEAVLVQKGCGSKMMHAKMPLEEGIEEVLTKSSHWDPIRLSSIGAKACSTEQLPFQDLIKSLYVKEIAENEQAQDDQKNVLDWFDCFQKHIPVHDTLVVAGDGAASPTVQCHPYTKYHLCIDGSQLIRLVPPLPFRANPALEQFATPIVQESLKGFPMSMGCQTKLSQNLNMFAHRHRDVDHSVDDPALRDIHKKSSDTTTGTTTSSSVVSGHTTNLYEQMQHWSEDASMLHSNFFLPAEHPRQPKLHHDLFHSTVLITGDMVVIPPGWWYQTYHLEPSVALHSQRCMGSDTATQFIDHVIQASGMDFHFNPEDDHQERHTREEAQTIVDTLFELLEEHYNEEEQMHPSKRYAADRNGNSDGFGRGPHPDDDDNHQNSDDYFGGGGNHNDGPGFDHGGGFE